MQDYDRLLVLLEEAKELASQYSGGYCSQFLSAEEFYSALSESINLLKQGDEDQLYKLYIWFLPTACWDDFIGTAGIYLGHEVYSMLARMHIRRKN